MNCLWNRRLYPNDCDLWFVYIFFSATVQVDYNVKDISKTTVALLQKMISIAEQLVDGVVLLNQVFFATNPLENKTSLSIVEFPKLQKLIQFQHIQIAS